MHPVTQLLLCGWTLAGWYSFKIVTDDADVMRLFLLHFSLHFWHYHLSLKTTSGFNYDQVPMTFGCEINEV